MNSLLVIAALGIAAMAYIKNQDLEDEIKNNEKLMEEQAEWWNEKFNEDVTTPESVINGVEVKSVMIGFSSISDKYMNCAAGVVWKNTTSEAINLVVDSATFSVGGYKMKVGAKDLTTIKIPANGTIYQDLFSYADKVLFATKEERKQLRCVIGDAQGHPGKEGRDIWGKANFDVVFNATFSAVGNLSDKGAGKQGYIKNYDGIGRYYGATALTWELKKWVRSYIGG